MHPDEKAQAAQDKTMPSVAAQQAYLASGADANLKPGTPLPPSGESRRPAPPEQRSVPRTPEPPKP